MDVLVEKCEQEKCPFADGEDFCTLRVLRDGKTEYFSFHMADEVPENCPLRDGPAWVEWRGEPGTLNYAEREVLRTAPERRVRVIYISQDFLRHFLEGKEIHAANVRTPLPGDAKLWRAGWNICRRTLDVYYVSKEFDPVPEGGRVPEQEMVFTREPDRWELLKERLKQAKVDIMDNCSPAGGMGQIVDTLDGVRELMRKIEEETTNDEDDEASPRSG